MGVRSVAAIYKRLIVYMSLDIHHDITQIMLKTASNAILVNQPLMLL